MRAPDVLVVVTDRLLHQHVLAGLEGGEREGLVIIAARDDVDDIDVGPREHFLVVRLDARHVEFLGASLRLFAIDVADHDEVDQRGPLPPGDVSHARPAARADHPNTQLVSHVDPPHCRDRTSIPPAAYL